MKANCILQKKLETRYGKSEKGEWWRGSFTTLYGENLDKKLYFEYSSDTVRDCMELLNEGDLVEVIFIPQSREHEGKWYTTLIATYVKKAT